MVTIRVSLRTSKVTPRATLFSSKLCVCDARHRLVLDYYGEVHHTYFFFFFSLTDKPVCLGNQKVIYGYAQNENAEIICEVDAYPFADAFSWSFNKSQDSRNKVDKHRKSERKRNASILHITPVTDMDYGSVLCSAKNSVGEQTEPCVFHIIKAGKWNA